MPIDFSIGIYNFKMKYLFIIIIALSTFNLFAQSYTFEWVSKTKFKDAVYPGKKYILKQLCQPKADSIASNGKITFWSASIDGIDELELSYLIKDTILLSTEFTTKGKDNCKMMETKISELTGGKKAFVSYGVNKTLYKVYLFSKDNIEYIIYYNCTTNMRYSHILIVPKYK